MKLGLREANQRFSQAIRAVRSGQDVVLTDRGRPVAVISPLRRPDAEQAALHALASEGLVIPAERKGPVPAPRWRPLAIKGTPLSQTVLDDREHRV